MIRSSQKALATLKQTAAAVLVIAASLTFPAHADNAAPSSASPAGTQPRQDNTAVNRADRSAAATTPMDQSNDKADLQVTADIRKAVVADDNLSTLAHNVKIITQDRTVTLRGPVNSMEEKRRIEGLARQYAGSAAVKSELTVKTE
jgi:hyperosmotically inducible protein